MIPNEVVEIFTSVTAVYGIVTSKSTFTDIDRFDEKINSILVELQRDHNRDEYRLLYLSQNLREYNSLIGLILTKIGTLATHDISIDTTASEAIHKKVEVL